MAKKIFKYRGKTIEELKALSDKEFSELLPSRERRTFERGFTDAEKVFLREVEKGKDNIKTHCRNVIIFPKMVGLTINIHRGNKFEAIKLTEEMVGHRLGEFALSRKIASHSSPGVGKTKVSVK